jgi:hypothetical protein
VDTIISEEHFASIFRVKVRNSCEVTRSLAKKVATQTKQEGRQIHN